MLEKSELLWIIFGVTVSVIIVLCCCGFGCIMIYVACCEDDENDDDEKAKKSVQNSTKTAENSRSDVGWSDSKLNSGM
jgi:hypothetical protein